MLVRLYSRHHGLHTLVKETEIPFTLSMYAKERKSDNHGQPCFAIDEKALIDALPDDFLLSKTSETLLTVEDKSKTGSTAQKNLKLFRNWSKYFDAYCITLCRP